MSFTNWATPNVSVDLIDDYYMTNGKPITDPASGYDSQNPYLNRDPRLAATYILPGDNSSISNYTYTPFEIGRAHV